MMTTSFINPLVVGRVIDEVIDRFEPTIAMSVMFGATNVINGCDVKPSIATERPTVCISGGHNNFFTLVMVDPDAPTPSDPAQREYVHWVVAGIPAGTDSTKGFEVLPYLPPDPILGIHRFVIVIFQQKQIFPRTFIITNRANFKTRFFAQQFNLGPPVASVYFNSRREPVPKRRRRSSNNDRKEHVV